MVFCKGLLSCDVLEGSLSTGVGGGQDRDMSTPHISALRRNRPSVVRGKEQEGSQACGGSLGAAVMAGGLWVRLATLVPAARSISVPHFPSSVWPASSPHLIIL